MRMFLTVVPDVPPMIEESTPLLMEIRNGDGKQVPHFGQEMEISVDDLRLDEAQFLPRFLASAFVGTQYMARDKGII